MTTNYDRQQQPAEGMYVPPPQNYQRPPQMPPKKPLFFSRKVAKLPIWVWIVIALALLVAANGTFNSGQSPTTSSVQPTAVATSAPAKTVATTVPTAAPTAIPTAAPAQWSIVKTFSGNLSGGNWYHSPYFTVADNWQVSWQSINRDPSMPIVNIVAYDHSGNPITGDDDIAAHGDASDTSGVGPVQKHGGTIQLQVYAQGDWSVTVSVEK